MNKPKEVVLKHYKKWRDLPFGEKFPLTKIDFARLYDMAEVTLDHWDKLLDAPPEVRVTLTEDGEVYDSEAWLKGRTLDMDRALIESARKGSPKSLELFYKLTGRKLIDKSEVDVKIGRSGDEIARANLRAERELRESGYRVEEVPKKSVILHEELCVGSGQCEAGDSQVGTLAPSGESDKPGTEMARPTTSEETPISDNL